MNESTAQEFIDVNGVRHTDRTPAKRLNKYTKSALLTILKRDDIKIIDKYYAGSNTITVTDSQGKFLFMYDNGWDYGYYQISMANPKDPEHPLVVAEMDHYENDNNTNSEQQDVFDVFNALTKKRAELEAIEEDRKALSPEEWHALQALGITR